MSTTTYIMLTRLAPGAMRSPRELEGLEREVMAKIRAECPGVEWLHSFAVLGPHDYVDIFRVPELELAVKVATIVRTFGHATTELWPALEWRRFKELVHGLATPRVPAPPEGFDVP
jgi:uncharacterized protein with GYD domain